MLFEREKALPIFYKNSKLKRTFVADFVCFENIIIETKAVKGLVDQFYAQVMNYLKGSSLRLGLLINFGEPSLKVKRIIL